MSPVTTGERRRGNGADVVEFIDTYCRITKDTIAGPVGAPIRCRPWQVQLLDSLFARRADGRRKHRQALIGMPRKNGKSALGSGIALFGLLAEADGAEVYSCAADRDQARIVFGMARRMVELDEELSGLVTLYRDAIEVPSTGSVYRVLSAEAYTKEGLSPNLVVFDEVHAQPNDDLWNVMNLGSGARIDPLILGVTTAGVRTDSLGRDSLCFRLYQHGQRVVRKELEDPTFLFCWWEPKAGAEADHSDPKVWAECNPGFGDLNDPEDFSSTLARTPEAEYRTKRTNVFVAGTESALPHGLWDKRVKPKRVVDPDEPVIIFVDGSWSGDSTGIVGCTIRAPHLFVVDAWENPHDRNDYRIPIGDVKAKITETCRNFRVIEVDMDPFRWQQTMDDLMNEGLPIVEYHTNHPARIVPAWKAFYDGVLDGTVSHDGDPRLARHLENMVLKVDQHGARPTKDHKSSRRHIDLGICAVGAHDRATLVGDAAPREFFGAYA